MEPKQGEPTRARFADLEKDAARLRDELAKVQKLNRSMTRQLQRAEQERTRQTETIELICQHGTDILAAFSRSGKIGFVTSSVSAALGFTPGELIGRQLQDLCTAEDREQFQSYLANICKGTGPFSLEIRLSDKAGRTHAFDLHGSVNVNPQTHTHEVMAILRKQNDELPTVPKEVAASLAHELNQPLTAISLAARACARLVRLERHTSRELVQSIDNLAAQAERAGELVRRMRQLMMGGGPRRSMTDLNLLTRQAFDQLTTDVQEGGIEVDWRLADNLPQLPVDPIQIGQVIVNLLRNAVEAMREASANGRRLTISTSRNGHEVDVTVSDTGPGLAPDIAPRLFHPFQTTKPGGMGLGLALSRSIVQAHGGRLGVAAPAKNGTTFFFSLPLTGETT
ncbi:MAG: PAS domain-containing protein [Planctomycetes bacterium]|nr:PAS domain-containing protein [Planctomycetota bacterium]